MDHLINNVYARLFICWICFFKQGYEDLNLWLRNNLPCALPTVPRSSSDLAVAVAAVLAVVAVVALAE